MSRIKLNLRNLSIPDKVQKGRQIITAMTNNANFSSPHPPLTEVTAALATLEQNYALVQAAKADVKAKAKRDGISLRALILQLLTQWVKG